MPDDASEEEKKTLKALLDAENSHSKQWPKHLMALGVVVSNLIVTLLRGSKNTKIIPIERCGFIDWSLFAMFVLLMFVASYFGVMINKKEQALKKKLNRGLIPSDIRFEGRPLRLLLIFAFAGGWVGGALGLGGGSIFNPLMIALGVPPSVSTSTGMYMIIYSSAATTIIFLVYGQLNLPFSIWLSFWCSMGIVAGISAINHIIK